MTATTENGRTELRCDRCKFLIKRRPRPAGLGVYKQRNDAGVEPFVRKNGTSVLFEHLCEICYSAVAAALLRAMTRPVPEVRPGHLEMRHDKDEGCLFVKWEDVPHDTDYLNTHLDLFRAADDGRVVGCYVDDTAGQGEGRPRRDGRE